MKIEKELGPRESYREMEPFTIERKKCEMESWWAQVTPEEEILGENA